MFHRLERERGEKRKKRSERNSLAPLTKTACIQRWTNFAMLRTKTIKTVRIKAGFLIRYFLNLVNKWRV